MLQPIHELVPDPFDRLFCRYDAIDTETGAIFFRTNGRGKGGLSTFVLIKPNEKPASETVWAQYCLDEWEYGNRKFIRAWTFTEALDKANKRLERM